MVRKAEHKDADAILSLAKDFATSFVIEEKAFRASVIALLADPSTHVAVAETKEGIIGYVVVFSHNTFYANGRVAWVEEIMVHANRRKQGIGKSLMQDVETWASGQGCKLIALATRRAANFYEALNYQASATYYRKVL
jgi:GNAT superfamily N-acetyltransferase